MIHVIKWTRSIFPLCFCILQAIKNWTVGRSRNKANIDAHMSYILNGAPLHHSECSNSIENGVVSVYPGLPHSFASLGPWSWQRWQKRFEIGGGVNNSWWDEQFVCVLTHAHARGVWGYLPLGKFCKLDALRLLLRPLLAQSGTTVIIVICISSHV